MARCVLIASHKEPVNGVGRTMIGGVVLQDFCLTRKWERWRGTLMFVPEKVEFMPKERGKTINQMMVDYMSLSQDELPKREKIWQTKWELP